MKSRHCTTSGTQESKSNHYADKPMAAVFDTAFHQTVPKTLTLRVAL